MEAEKGRKTALLPLRKFFAVNAPKSQHSSPGDDLITTLLKKDTLTVFEVLSECNISLQQVGSDDLRQMN